jgi:hypothetical protein
MERFWNIVHYSVYRADYKLHLLFNKINPLRLLFKLHHSKRNFEKLGVDPMNALNEAFKRPDIGISSIRAGGFMYILVFLICFGLVNIFCGLSQISIRLRLYHFMIFVIASLVVNYFLLFQQKKYLAYFKEFEKMPKEEKKKWALLSSLAIIGIILFFIGSFFYMNYRL